MRRKTRELPREIVDEARNAVWALDVLARQRRSRRVIRLGAEGPRGIVWAEVPRRAYEILLQVLCQMRDGHAAMVVPIHAELTTQQAAEILSVSRPHLVKLLEQGKMPSRKVGRHRRVRSEDVLEFQRTQRSQVGSVEEMLARLKSPDGGTS